MKNTKQIREKSFELVKKIIDQVGPRLAGTKQSIDGGDLLYREIEGYTQDVSKEYFNVYKGAFLGWIKILVASYLLGILFLWFDFPIISIVLTIASLFILVFQFFLYKPLIDKLYPKKTGMNIIGKIEPTEKVKRQVIISGHHDSARVFNFLIHQPKLYNLRVTGGIGLIIALLVSSIFLVFFNDGILVIIIKVLLSLGFLLTGQMWFFAGKNGTPGAGDNLISSAVAVEIGRYFSHEQLKHTRIIIASFDAEEEGLRGARAYALKHENDFKEVPTYLLNADCPYFLKDIFFLTTDINCSVPLSEKLANELVEVASSLGYSTSAKPIEFLTGGTDAGELAKKGVFATTLMAMPWSNSQRANVYHTPNDTIDSIDPMAIDAMIDIFITYIIKEDK